MPLQNLTKQTIDNAFGLDSLIKGLDKSLKMVNASHKQCFYINNLIIYLRILYTIKVDLVQDILDHKESALITLDILNDLYGQTKCVHVKLISDVVSYNINYVSGIRKIG